MHMYTHKYTCMHLYIHTSISPDNRMFINQRYLAHNKALLPRLGAHIQIHAKNLVLVGNLGVPNFACTEMQYIHISNHI
jgi:hypothetical protein